MPESAGSTTSPPGVRLGGETPILRVENLDTSVAYYEITGSL